jgi:flagellar hook-length control protein FliK
MENQAISTHVVVTNSHASKPSEAPANGLPGAQNADFANLLTAQLNAQTLPLADVAATSNAKPAQAEKPATELAAEPDKKEAPQDSSQLGAALNILPLAQFPIAQQTLQATIGAAEKIKSDAAVLDATSGKAMLSNLAVGLAVTAKPSEEPAKIAASDKSLPLDPITEIKVDTSKLGTDFATQLSQMNRQEPVAVNTTVATLPPIEVRLGQPGWDGAFSQRVTWAATNNQQVAQLQLNPPNLGPVEVRITIVNDQTNAVFVSPHAAVCDAIEAALPRLREMLADSGLTLGNVNVSSQSFAQQQQQQQEAQQGHGESGRREDHLRDLDSSLASKVLVGGQVGVSSLMLGRNGLVDIFA